MRPSPRQIQPLPATHESRAVETLVRSFAEDPGIVHLFPDAVRRPTGLAHIFRMQVRYGLRHGLVDGIPGGTAVAVWARPENAWPTWRRMIQVGMLAMPRVVGLIATWRLLRFQRVLETIRRGLLNGPHWYLFAIGVHPERQGEGLGTALLRHGVGRAQTTGLPCYLETTHARNLPFYEKHGFRVREERRWPRSGLRIWGLVAGRDRATAATGVEP
jgi:ribosomal protein S18 acetylase RimI-like enzyme